MNNATSITFLFLYKMYNKYIKTYVLIDFLPCFSGDTCKESKLGYKNR